MQPDYHLPKKRPLARWLGIIVAIALTIGAVMVWAHFQTPPPPVQVHTSTFTESVN